MATLNVRILVAVAIFVSAAAQADTPPGVLVFEREVSLTAKGMTLEEALREVARQAGVEFDPDREALAEAELDLAGRIDVEIDRQPLGEALGSLIGWGEHPGVYRELRRGKLFLTTLAAQSRRVKARLPDWLAALDGKGVLAHLDENDEIAELYMDGPQVTDEFLARLKSLPGLRKLDIGSSTALTKAGFAALGDLKSLESLEVHGRDLGLGLGDDVVRAVVGLDSLRELSLGETGITDVGATLLERMPRLKSLRLYQEPRLTDAAVSSVATLDGLEILDLTSYVGFENYGRMKFSPDALWQLAALQNLEVLRLDGHEYPAGQFAFPKLRVLSVAGPRVDDRFAKSLLECPQLRALTLTQAGITDAGLESIAALPELRRLELDDVRISDAGLAHLRRCPHLEHVELRRIDYTDAGVAHLAEVKALTRLDLGCTRATVAGLGQLETLPRLRTLWLFGFRGDGYNELARLKQLRELHLEMCSIDEPTLHALERDLPKVRISAGTGGGYLRSSRPSKF